MEIDAKVIFVMEFDIQELIISQMEEKLKQPKDLLLNLSFNLFLIQGLRQDLHIWDPSLPLLLLFGPPG
jgi:hypothetical protein